MLLHVTLLLLLCTLVTADCPYKDWLDISQKGNLLCSDVEPSDIQWMPSISNGYIGTLVSSDTVFVSGVYNGELGVTPSHRARIPSSTAINLDLEKIASALDLKNGVFLRRSKLTSQICNGSLDSSFVEQRWYSHRKYSSLLVHEIELVNAENLSCTISLSVNSGNSSSDINFKSNTIDSIQLMDGYTLIPETKNSQTTEVAVASTVVPSTLRLTSHQPVAFFIATYHTSLETSSPSKTALETYRKLISNPYQLLIEHKKQWNETWDSGIEVEGNLDMAKAINSSLFNIISNIRYDWPYGISPGGIATNSYNGHIFWDSETWMYPNMLLLQPDLAETLLRYRILRLPAAKSKAIDFGYTGALFPWESAFTGAETCPDWAPEGKWEQHISGDISLAARQYFYSTNDTKWLSNGGYQLVNEIAKFWASRVEYDSENKHYIINGVQPPDESAGEVNNSIWTNAIAAASLEFAIELGELLNKPTPAIWKEISENIKIPFDANLQVHMEYDGYDGHLINQADVVLLQYPLMYMMTTEIAWNDIIYWTNKTNRNGYFTGDSAYSIAWLNLGNLDSALSEFDQSFLHIRPPFNVWNEKITGGHSHFITGAGGFLQNVLYGFGGIRVSRDHLSIKPTLPLSLVESFTFRKMSYLGTKFSLSFNQTAISIECNSEKTQLKVKDINTNHIDTLVCDHTNRILYFSMPSILHIFKA